jgi:hypothetical protein
MLFLGGCPLVRAQQPSCIAERSHRRLSIRTVDVLASQRFQLRGCGKQRFVAELRAASLSLGVHGA